MFKRLMYGAIAAFVCGASLDAQSPYVKKVTLTIDNTSGGIGFVASDVQQGNGHPQAVRADCVSDTSSGNFNFTVDGTAPTASAGGGAVVTPGSSFTISGPPLIQAFKGIRTGSTSATVVCHIYG